MERQPHRAHVKSASSLRRYSAYKEALMNSPQRMVDSSTQRLPGSVALRERKSDAASQAATGRLSATAMRNALEPFGRKRNAYALMLLAIDLSLFVVGQFLAITATSGWLQILGTLVTLAAIVRLFLI